MPRDFGDRPHPLQKVFELRNPRTIEAGSIEDFAQILLEYPLEVGRHRKLAYEIMLRQEGITPIPHAPFVHVEVLPEGTSGESFTLIDRRTTRPTVISYLEQNPVDVKKLEEKAERLRREQNAKRNAIASEASDAARRSAQKAEAAQADIEGHPLTAILSIFAAPVVQFAIRKEADQLTRQVDSVDPAILQAYNTAKTRIEELRALLGERQTNLVVSYVGKFHNQPEIESRLLEGEGDVIPWQKPQPRKTRRNRW